MSINNLPEYVKNLADWGLIEDCFRGKVSPTDIDGLVERNGHFLLLEGKSRGVKIKVGQEILLREWAAKPHCTAIVFWGPLSDPNRLRWMHGHDVIEVDGDLARLRAWLRRWDHYSRTGRGAAMPSPPAD